MHNQKLFNGDMLSFITVTPVSSFSSLVVILVFPFDLWWVSEIYCLFLIQASGQQIPIVVESCIRYINLHGESSLLK